MQCLFAQISKEWARFSRDRVALLLALLLPLATLLLFGYGVRLEPTHIPVVIQDFDRSPLSEEYIADFEKTKSIMSVDIGAQPPEQALRSGRAKAALIIPEGFSHCLFSDQKTKVKMLVDGSDINVAQMMRAVTFDATASFLKNNQPPDVEISTITPRVHVLFNSRLDETKFIVPGVFAIILWMYPALLAAVTAAREAEDATLLQVKCSSLNATHLIVGKAVVYAGVAIAQATVIVLAAIWFFHLRASCIPGPFLIASLLYVVAAVLFGLMVGTLTKSQTVAVQATATGGFFPSLLLSGFVYPIANIPVPLNEVCSLVPATYYIAVSRDFFIRGVGWSACLLPVLALSGFIAVLYSFCHLATTRLRNAEA